MNRKGMALIAVAVLVLASGCLGLVLGDGLDEEAQPAAVEQATLDDSEFHHQQSDVVEIDESVEVAGQERQIRATNHVTVYTREAELPTGEQQAAGFTAVTTPEFAVAGRSLNPLATMSNRELVDELEGQLDEQVDGELGEIRHVDDRTETMLGEEVTVSTFATDTEVEGREVTLNVHVAKVVHDGDVVVAVGAHPEELGHVAPEVYELIRNVEHPAETA